MVIDVRRQRVGEADQRLIFILVAVVLEDGGIDREPQQRGSTAPSLRRGRLWRVNSESMMVV
jgi:hypothetical protein